MLEALSGRVYVTVTKLPAPRLQVMSCAELPTFVWGIPNRPEVGHTPAFCTNQTDESMQLPDTPSSYFELVRQKIRGPLQDAEGIRMSDIL